MNELARAAAIATTYVCGPRGESKPIYAPTDTLIPAMPRGQEA